MHTPSPAAGRELIKPELGIDPADPFPSTAPAAAGTSVGASGGDASAERPPPRDRDRERDAREKPRPRITVVCAECKRLKLKCDRKSPCGSCAKRECADRCLYSQAAAEKIDVQSLHNRVQVLETALAALAAHPAFAPALAHLRLGQPGSGPPSGLHEPLAALAGLKRKRSHAAEDGHPGPDAADDEGDDDDDENDDVPAGPAALEPPRLVRPALSVGVPAGAYPPMVPDSPHAAPPPIPLPTPRSASGSDASRASARRYSSSSASSKDRPQIGVRTRQGSKDGKERGGAKPREPPRASAFGLFAPEPTSTPAPDAPAGASALTWDRSAYARHGDTFAALAYYVPPPSAPAEAAGAGAGAASYPPTPVVPGSSAPALTYYDAAYTYAGPTGLPPPSALAPSLSGGPGTGAAYSRAYAEPEYSAPHAYGAAPLHAPSRKASAYASDAYAEHTSAPGPWDAPAPSTGHLSGPDFYPEYGAVAPVPGSERRW